MEEKSQIKISLGTMICIVVIVILSCTLINVLLNNSNNVVNDNPAPVANNNSSTGDSKKYVPLSVFTANKKDVDPNLDEFYLQKSFFGFNVYVDKDGQVEFNFKNEVSDFVLLGIINQESESKISKNVSYKISGFDKKVVDMEMGCNGQEISGFYMVFLMEDGTLEYTSIKNLITNLSVEGKIDGVSNIVKLQSVHYAISNVFALDYENNLYDIGYMINK